MLRLLHRKKVKLSPKTILYILQIRIDSVSMAFDVVVGLHFHLVGYSEGKLQLYHFYVVDHYQITGLKQWLLHVSELVVEL